MSSSAPDSSGLTFRTPTALAITGAAGALGSHVVRTALTETALPVRVLVHRTELAGDLRSSRVTCIRGSLLDPASLDEWLCAGAAVVHLAWSSSMVREEHLRAVVGLADAAARHNVARFVHVSTAVVAGRTSATIVNEDTPCEPATDYEITKYEIERAIEASAAGRFPLVILRPTAVFGAGLKNLVTLIESLRRGRALVNYARACLFGCRNLHLVPVETVAGAVLFTAVGRHGHHDADRPLRYIVSADDERGGDFCSVETTIRRALSLGASPPRVRIPSIVLRLMLKAAGRSDTNPHRVYDGSRLRRAGFVPLVTLRDALARYIARYGTAAEGGGAP